MKLAFTSTPGYGVWIDLTTNLTAWQPLTNFLNTNGSLTFTDASASNSALGFYRIRQ
jgi:hypothetical protein